MSDRCKVLVFGGTTEGRILTEHLVRMHIDHEVSVATKYGRDILKDIDEDNLLVGRKDEKEIRKVIIDGGFNLVIDATHPFATEVSRQIKSACKEQGVTYLRLLRDTGKKASCSADHHEDFSTEVYTKGLSDVVYVDDIIDAIEQLKRVSGNILLLTGSKNLAEIAGGIPDSSKRLYARVLPSEESIRKCLDAGLSGRQIIAMQGPFSKEMNMATIREVGASAILTKESGKTGGLDEKISAALECGVKVFVIKNPESGDSGNAGCSLEEVLDIISEHTGEEIHLQKTITLAGIGPGGEAFHTMALEEAFGQADVIFGAKAVLKNIRKGNVICIPEYQGEKILDYLSQNPEYEHPIVLFSGDISLCSGAKKATEYFETNGYRVKRISGISSVTVFAERLGLSLENVRLISAHGKECNVLGYVKTNMEVIILTSNAEHAAKICEELKDTNICGNSDVSVAKASRNNDAYNKVNNEIDDGIRIIVGCDLGTEDEKLIEVNGEATDSSDISGKCLIYVKNPNAANESLVKGLSDDEIIRGKAPMTKEEVRALSMRKLALCPDSVIYDIGAGTGSISLEAALLAPDIKVFAIEKNDEAFFLLKQNKEKFSAGNMVIIHGEAPDALSELPVPTHAFIGGSSGNMREILRTVYDKNDEALVVINTVTAETFAEVMECIKDYPDIESDIIQVAATRFKKVGRYHLADALNPVYIITLRKGVHDDKD